MDVVFNPDEYRRGFSNEQIVDHVADCLAMTNEILHRNHRVPADLPVEMRVEVFRVVQLMRATMQKIESPVAVPKIGIAS